MHLGPLKVRFTQAISDSWPDLADMLDIPLADQRRFAPGEQGRHIWEWLAARSRLADLPRALKAIGRPELAAELIMLHSSAPTGSKRDPGIVTTGLRTHHSGRRWIGVYNDVRMGSSTEAVVVYDERDSPDTPLDLLLVVYDDFVVIRSQVSEAVVADWQDRVRAETSLDAVVLVVGKNCDAAQPIASRWLDPLPGRVHLELVRSSQGLRREMSSCIEDAIKRNPRRWATSPGTGIYRSGLSDRNVGEL